MYHQYLVIIFLSLILLSCEKSDSVTKMNVEQLKTTFKKPTPDYLTDSLRLENKTYKVVQAHPHSDKDFPLCIIYGNDTVYRHNSSAGNGFSFEDFDGNGMPDILLHHLSNIGGVKEWITFDSGTGRFKEIKKFNDFPSAERLAGTKYFYSDHKMGCAGGMWGSELFYIENFEAHAVANIIIVNCPDSEYPLGVSVNKLSDKNEILFEHIAAVPEHYNNDSDFFQDYWRKNHKDFE